MGGPPSICVLLANWWGGTWENYAFLVEISAAANIWVGGNPLYQLSDFLAVYPKFGSISTGSPFQRYYPIESPNGVINVFHFGGQATSSNDIQFFRNGELQNEGEDYGLLLANGVTTITTTWTAAADDQLTIYFPAVTGLYVGVIPQAVLQMYINLATASLQFARWQDSWLFGMALFVAHYATLYLRSEGSPGTTAQQIASSGLALGLATSKSAGDVSLGFQYLTGWENWGSWNLTLYGQQLISMANIIGMGGMYIYG